ncbi:hypothetical protein CMV_006097 [Castanea mollissima]|uniref:Uncharacterized protein n=1 Tax=Castanea mollissima TaxID=60419 RepID=A0A8J4VTX0_9ROSI|nr:hypothetical protein CMV_006097 [Castanea mollissima]
MRVTHLLLPALISLLCPYIYFSSFSYCSCSLAFHVAHFLFNSDRSPLSPFIPMPDRDSFHRAGGTPWGLGFALVLLCFMISYHSYFKESWFPLLHRNK